MDWVRIGCSKTLLLHDILTQSACLFSNFSLYSYNVAFPKKWLELGYLEKGSLEILILVGYYVSFYSCVRLIGLELKQVLKRADTFFEQSRKFFILATKQGSRVNKLIERVY